MKIYKNSQRGFSPAVTVRVRKLNIYVLMRRKKKTNLFSMRQKQNSYLQWLKEHSDIPEIHINKAKT